MDWLHALGAIGVASCGALRHLPPSMFNNLFFQFTLELHIVVISPNILQSMTAAAVV